MSYLIINGDSKIVSGSGDWRDRVVDRTVVDAKSVDRLIEEANKEMEQFAGSPFVDLNKDRKEE